MAVEFPIRDETVPLAFVRGGNTNPAAGTQPLIQENRMNTEKIGFLGLGSMGAPMARNLLKSALAVTVYNRTRSLAEDLRADGAEIADTPAGAVVAGGIAITMLANDAALEALIRGCRSIATRIAGNAGVEPGELVVPADVADPLTTTLAILRHAISLAMTLLTIEVLIC